MRYRLPIFITTILAILLISTAAAASQESGALKNDDQCTEVRDRLIDWAARTAVNYRYRQWYPRRKSTRALSSRGAEEAPALDSTTSAAPRAEGSASSGPSNYTKTNVQEQGVDEADIVKTDGQHIYTVNGNDLIILDSWPLSSARIISRTAMGKGVTPRQLFLNGDRLVVLSRVFEKLDDAPTYQSGRQYDWRYYYWNARYNFRATRISVFDVSEREEPRLLRNIDVEGWMNQARMIDDDVYLVSNARLQYPPELMKEAMTFEDGMPEEGRKNRNHKNVQKTREEGFQVLRQHLRSHFSDLDVATDAMPRTRHSAYRQKGLGELETMYRCGDVYVPSSGAQVGILSLTHVDIDRTWDARTIGVFGSGWQVYASRTAMYVGMPDYGWGYYWGWGGRESEGNRTAIHKFNLRGIGDRPTYAASGYVQGFLLNQFSMSEWKGDLRVATTDQRWMRRQRDENPGNNIFVLRQSGRSLDVIGGVTGLAEGERIYAARMMGDKGYVVTFRQVDPLFTLDLSDPRDPKVVGELKIPGFSSYIHPLDSDHLLTVGQDANDRGRTQGVHLQIFDVSDPAEPKRTFHHRLDINGRSWSRAQWDHHAFTYDAHSGTLAIPLSVYNGPHPFQGIVTFHVDAEDGFVETGRISHRPLVEKHRQNVCEKASAKKLSSVCGDSNQRRYNWYTNLSRSIVMDDYVVTLSNYGLMAHKIYDQVEPLASILFLKSS